MATLRQDEPPPRPVGHENIDGKLHTPVLRFDLNAEIAHLKKQEAWRTGTSSTTLVKHPDLRVVLVAMRKGEVMPEHRTVGRITVQALSGTLRLRVEGRTEELKSGHILVLDRGIAHDVEAVEESAFLLTLAWPETQADLERADRERAERERGNSPDGSA